MQMKHLQINTGSLKFYLTYLSLDASEILKSLKV